jgi:hypothetical protein
MLDHLDAAAANIREIAKPIRDKWRAARPEWRQTDSPLKYVDWAMHETIDKSADLCRLLAPECLSVVELGPGACFLAYMLRQLGNRVRCYDVPDRPLYRDTAAALDVWVDDWTIEPGTALPLVYPDLIIGTQISWLNEFTPAEGQRFVGDLVRGLPPHGRLVLFPNPQAFGGADPGDVWAPCRPVEVTMRHLGRGFIFTR